MSEENHGSSIRDIIAAVKHQIRALWPLLVLIYLPVVLALDKVVAIRLTTGIAIAEFTRDPLGYTDIPVYKGMLSNIGVLIWAAGAAISFFSYGVTRGASQATSGTRILLAGGLITALLTLDDLFMLHEVVFPEHIGINEGIVYAAYGAALIWFVAWYQETILRTNFILLAAAFAAFGISVVSDLIAPLYSIPGLYIFEDGGKLFGIVSWTTYFISVSVQQLAGGRYVSEAGKADTG